VGVFNLRRIGVILAEPSAADTMIDSPDTTDYEVLATFRYHLRRFLATTEAYARQAGLEPQQHQLLLAIKGLPTRCRATIATLADRLQIQHQSAVELVDRLEAKGLVSRTRHREDRRCVLVSLTAKGEQELAPLVERSLQQLADTGQELIRALDTAIVHSTRS
jgi:DNA-binding MarR family transcriptional regulator